MAITYIVEREVVGIPSSDMNEITKITRRDTAASKFDDLVYDTIRAMAWLDTDAGVKAYQEGQRISDAITTHTIRKGHNIKHWLTIGDFKLSIMVIN